MYTSTPEPSRYPALRRLMHWIGVPLLGAAFAAGGIAAHGGLGPDAHLLVVRLHLGLGMLGALLVVIRIVACLRMPGPGPLDLPAWRQRVFDITHRVTYLSVVLLGVTGIAMAAWHGVGDYARGLAAMPTFEGHVVRTAHGGLAWLFAGLVAAHVGGVLSYQLSKGRTLARMGIGKAASR